MIKREKTKWVLYTKDGTKKLGTFTTRKQAEAREKEIKMFKHVKKRGSK